MLRISSIRHAWPEKAGFDLVREHGLPYYTFLHFFGSVELLVGGREICTRPHACILYAPGTPQRIRSAGPLLHDWLHFSGEPDSAPLSSLLACDAVCYPGGAEWITETVREMETEFFAARQHRELLLSLKLQELLIQLSRSAAGVEDQTLDAATAEQLRLLRGEVFSHLGRHWTAARMAERVHLSQSHFFSLYKRLYGISPIADLIHARVDAAKNALSFSGANLSEIAEGLGYSSLSHFLRQFRACTGETPSEFRRRQRGGAEGEGEKDGESAASAPDSPR